MDRWLEEYFAELETVFGLGLFSMKRSGGLDSGEDSVQAYAAGNAPGQRVLNQQNAPVQDEVLSFQTALEEQEIKINRMIGMESEAFYEAAMAGNGLAWEFDRPDAETRAADAERWETAETKAEGEEVTASRTEQNEWDEIAGVLFPGADSFEAMLSPVVLMEQAESDTDGGQSAEKGQTLWREAVAVRGKAEEEEAESGGLSAAFPEGRAAEGDEMIDLLLDELERRLMLEVGGAAEGRY